MAMPGFTPEPLRVTCKACGVTAETWDYQHPDLAVVCGCCPVGHDHTGLGCRPVTIVATAHLTMFDLTELMDVAAGAVPIPDENPIKVVG
jgi:hypothetical protein